MSMNSEIKEMLEADVREQANLDIKKAKPKLSFLPRMYSTILGAQFNAAREFVDDNTALSPPFDIIAELPEAARIMEFGAKKYSPLGWQKVPVEDFEEALLRHCYDYIHSEIDEESGFSHQGHIACNILIILWHRHNEQA